MVSVPDKKQTNEEVAHTSRLPHTKITNCNNLHSPTSMSDEEEAIDEDDPEPEEENEGSGPTKEQWIAVRKLLKDALLSNSIPLESTELRPKQVWQKYMDVGDPDIQCIDYANITVRDKHTRMLRALRKKHKDGDLEHEDENAPT